MSFIHLHNHSVFSLLDGASKINPMVERAKKLNMNAIALTDHGVMHGVIDFYKKCKKEGIKPIIGCEVYVAQRGRFQKESGFDDKPYHLVLLAKDNEGYHNLTKLVSLAWLEGFYYKPRIDLEILEKYSKGLIATSACLAGEIPRLVQAEKYSEAKERAQWHQKIFGEGNYYLEIQDQGIEEQRNINRQIKKISDETGIPMVATNDSHYIEKEDAKIQDVLLCIQTGRILEDENRMRFSTDEFYLKNYDEMKLALGEYPEALENTQKIADACNVDFEFGNNSFPDFDVPEGYDLESYFDKLCEDGMIKRYGEPTEEIYKRLEFEKKIIKDMEYVGYFLIVWDFINYAKRKGIFVGPGRGSAAGSIVSYCLEITDIDPLKYDLIFERFLNPERVSMPDIDIDFCYERRQEVIDYVVRKYGKEKVSQIITFGTMAARAAIRDVGRVMNIPLAQVDKVAKMIPAEVGITIERAYETNPELVRAMEDDKNIKELVRTAKKLEGTPRHSGTHAAGVVISQKPLDEYLPLQKTGDDFLVTQFAKENVEEIGLLKMDFLGLRTLTVVNKAIEMIEKNRGEKVDFEKVDLEDEKTYELLSKGATVGVFQLESSGLRAILKDLKPESFEDIIALVALYRPGPLGSGMVDDFIKRKHGEMKVEYLHPILEPILENTYGVILYQEQVMRIASEMAGFTLGEADLLRRAMGKKKKEIIEGVKKQFIEGSSKNGIDSDVASKVFELIEYFAGYGFNKSHSAAYALISFQTAYLKANYPNEYMAALLTSVMETQDKVPFYIAEAEKMGINVLPPNINESRENFEAVNENIVFGLVAVKNVGKGAIEAILKARDEEGVFASLPDFTTRVDLTHTNKRAIESLIKAGSFEKINPNRAQLLKILEPCYQQSQSLQKNLNSKQLSFFEIGEDAGFKPNDLNIDIPDINDFTEKEKLAMEKEYLGFYVSGHPLDEYRDALKAKSKITIDKLKSLRDRQKVQIGGILSKAAKKPTKRGPTMAYCTLEDLTGSVEVLVFPRTLEKYFDLVYEDNIVIIEGSINQQEENIKIFAEGVYILHQEEKSTAKEDIQIQEPQKEIKRKLIIKIAETYNVNKVLLDIKDTLMKHSGKDRVFIEFPRLKKELLLDEDSWVTINNELTNELTKKIGSRNYKISNE